MTFAEAVRACFRRYATFSHRARRSEFWWFSLFLVLAQIILGLIDAALLGVAPDGSGPLGLAFSLATLLPGLAVSVRRLHDIGRSGWWYLLILVPLAGALVLLWWWTRPSEPGANRFGPPPDDPAALADSAVPRVPRGGRP